ncbi:MAG: DUF4416 family protein [Planctomycetota bacterium]
MAATRPIEPVIRFCAVISRYEAARDWALRRIESHWGPIGLRGKPTPFVAGGFYDATMGDGLIKQLVAIKDVSDPAGLADWKCETNQWELDYAQSSAHDEARPLNLDPGYITQAKLVLATTKDRDHRLYLRHGMFAEVTLNYVGKKWIHHRWTYPDYRTPEVAEFTQSCRDQVRQHLIATGGFRNV